MTSTANLYGAVALAFFGFSVFLAGVAVSFRTALDPLMEWFAWTWNRAVSALVTPASLEATNHLVGGFMLLLGGYLSYRGIRKFFVRIAEVVNPESKQGAVDAYVRKQMLSRGPRIVALGGGTGLSTLLRGLKQVSSNITAIVTVTDDGGSSGRLVQELGIIPPGDLRNCLVALADAEKRMTDLFQHRFQGASGSLSGHSVGNLFIAGLVEQSGGDFEKALQVASEVLAIRGRVVPSTLSHVHLKAVMEDGSEVRGETKIVECDKTIRKIMIEPADCEPHPEALRAIRDADLVCIGPGSVYTSVIPNLLVPGISQALRDSQALKVYICNVMTQHGESDAFTAAEHVVAITANVDHRVFDIVLVNTGMPSQAALDKYREFKQSWVEPDSDRISQMGFRVATGNLMSETDYVRHDPVHVTAKLMELLFK